MPYTIMLDSGHGGRDPGAVYNGRQEKDDALRLALAIGEILQDRGVDVLYTRTEDVYESPFEKAMEANTADADFFLSIHRNSYPTDNTVSGVESLIYDKSGIKFEMAENINEQLEAVGFVNLGVKERPNLVVLKRTRMPAVLVEVGFINSDTDNQLFDENFQDIVEAIAAGIVDTLGLDPVENAAEVFSETPAPIESSTENSTGNSIEVPVEDSVEVSAKVPVSVPIEVSANNPAWDSDNIPVNHSNSRNSAADKNVNPESKTYNTPNHSDSASLTTSEPARKSTSSQTDASLYHYHVQVGAFRMELYANRLLEELMEQNFPAFLVHTGNIYRVYVGAFSSLSEAIKMERLLKRAGYPTVIIA